MHEHGRLADRGGRPGRDRPPGGGRDGGHADSRHRSVRHREDPRPAFLIGVVAAAAMATQACSGSAGVGPALPTPQESPATQAAAPSPITCGHGTPPPGRRYGALVFDADRDVLVLFGGLKADSPADELADTWTWD